MESRWMRRKTENGSEEKFYPITHKDAVVNLNETLLEKADVVDVVTTEFAEEEIIGDAPELSPIAAQRIAELEARIAELENGGSGGESTPMSHVYAAIMDMGGEYTLQTIDGSESFSPEEPFLQGGKDIYVWNPNSGKTSKVLALNVPGNNTYEMVYIDASEGDIKVLIYNITEKTIRLKIY